MADLDKGRRAPQLLLQSMPHIIPHEERVRLFRKYITNEKTVLGLTESACASPQSTLITIHRFCFATYIYIFCNYRLLNYAKNPPDHV